MTIIVIPDIHNAPNLSDVEKVISEEAPDVTVFLGDYFDQWGDSPADNVRTAKWLKGSLATPKRIHLLGNHDAQYFDRRPFIARSGFTIPKYEAIRGVLNRANWAQLKLAHWEGDWLFTHAGWSKHHCPDNLTHIEMRTFLDKEIEVAQSNILPPGGSWIWGVGKMRGGDFSAGGLLWCDAREFRSIPNLNQVFGHTPGSLTNLSLGSEKAWVIDTTTREGVHHILRIVDGVVMIRELFGASYRKLRCRSSD